MNGQSTNVKPDTGADSVRRNLPLARGAPRAHKLRRRNLRVSDLAWFQPAGVGHFSSGESGALFDRA